MLDLVQWPALVVTVAAAWLGGSQRKKRRNIGFWAFLLSNLLWAVWGWQSNAYALIFQQFCLAAINARGVRKNEDF